MYDACAVSIVRVHEVLDISATFKIEILTAIKV